MTESYLLPPDFRIVSGGQTGADQAGLDWAIAHGIPHGGWCPKGRRSEDGRIDDRYHLRETPDERYLQRTEWNVRDSDATVVFTLDDVLDGGSKQTVDFAERLAKPWLHMRPPVATKCLARFLGHHNVVVLNVAGKRESAAPGIGAYVLAMLDAALRAPPAASKP